MGILYNRFNADYSETKFWTLITTITEQSTAVSLGDLTGKTELLVVCNNMVSALFCISDRNRNSTYYTGSALSIKGKIVLNENEYAAQKTAQCGTAKLQ